MAKRLQELPVTIHVRIERPEHGEPYLVASDCGIYGALDTDGPELIGVYELHKVVKAERIVKWEEVKKARGK